MDIQCIKNGKNAYEKIGHVANEHKPCEYFT